MELKMNNDAKNYYEVLEVPAQSTLQEIHNAYVRAKNAYSEDSAALYSLMTQDECSQILGQIEEAYTILGAPEKRREYDNVRGFNQNLTQAGFTEEAMKKPTYKPNNASADLLLGTPTSSMMSADDSFSRRQEMQKEQFKYNQEHSAKSDVEVSKVQAYKKFGLNYSMNDEMEQKIENCVDYRGDFLKEIREYKEVTIERLADMTKISKTYIRNIEDDEFAKLPADVYTRGFVYQIAKCLKLNPDLVATSYIHHVRQLKNPPKQ
jgi:curved DNA-binding protein CbpA